MSYCRFGDDSDLYIYGHVGGWFECCACGLAELQKTIFTTGLNEDDPRIGLFGEIPPCEKCNGEGCEICMMPGNAKFETRTELIDHVKEHIKAGHKVPEYVIEQLEKELKEEGEMMEPLFDDGYDGPAVFNFKTGEVQKATDYLRGFEIEEE